MGAILSPIRQNRISLSKPQQFGGRIAVVVLAALFASDWSGPWVTKAAWAEAPAAINKPARGKNPFERRIPAPPLEGGVEWVNTTEPLRLERLRGRFVLLDFWTFCCINCMHVLPEIKQLEQAFPEELVVIGVHTAKFAGERDTENIREAVLRYEIEHPVLNDGRQQIWQTYGVRSWPTLVLIDPEGNVVWAASGERKFEDMKAVIDLGLPYYRAQGLLKPAPRPTLTTSAPAAPTALRFPGKVMVDSVGGRLFIADSNHERIVVAGLDGKLQQVIGSGEIGRADGGFEAASFNHPQGMAIVGDMLYVADTENHLIRKVDLAKKQVSTVAGTGEQASAWLDEKTPTSRAGGRPKGTAISSPWSLWVHEDHLYIAMAGTHQIWRMKLDESRIGPFAGSGREDIADGPLLPPRPYEAGFASFAQPSELTSDGKRLYVADSEGSTVRSVPFSPRGRVGTLVGLTGTLFDFGDVDGEGRVVRLQHPLGVAWADGLLYVADTYNNKIKVIDVDKATCQTLAGTGKTGNADAEDGKQATFNEPGGIWAAGGKLYVADTNNHAIRVVELKAPYAVSTLEIEGLEPLAAPATQ